MTVLVLGGYGAVGTTLVSELRASGSVAIAAGRDSSRADLVVDLADPDSYRRALNGVEVVVNASGVEDPALATLATREAAAFVDITASIAYVTRLESLVPAGPVLLSVGLAPGLSNLLAAQVHKTTPEPIDIALVLGAGERHGAAATEWTYRLLGQRFPDPLGGSPVRNFTRPTTFEVPGLGQRRLYMADFSDQHTLTRDQGVTVRTYFGLDSRLATTALASMTWIPGASRLRTNLHLPGSDQWIVAARAGNATQIAHGRNQSRGTAVVTAAATQAVSSLAPGVHHLHRVITTAAIPSGRGIVLD